MSLHFTRGWLRFVGRAQQSKRGGRAPKCSGVPVLSDFVALWDEYSAENKIFSFANKTASGSWPVIASSSAPDLEREPHTD